jgi:hypothetical protein
VGGTTLSQIGKSNDGIYSHGSRSYDNNWQLDGISVSDVLGAGSISGGIPLPNPDTLQEFKVQTGLYDASFGRGSGANVSVVTKQGGNRFHGSLFEFLRNEALNANDYFLNETGQTRAELKQNQFGGTLGGPIRKDKLLFFVSYQGTRQENGIAVGQSRVACSAASTEPALADNRSPAALGKLFGGMTGALGGAAVAGGAGECRGERVMRSKAAVLRNSCLLSAIPGCSRSPLQQRSAASPETIPIQSGFGMRSRLRRYASARRRAFFPPRPAFTS